MKLFFTSLLALFISASFGQPAISKNKIIVDSLSLNEFTAFQSYLKKFTTSKINDTIIIKYDFNNESCWDMLDRQEDDYIKTIISNHRLRIGKAISSRSAVSIFEFRQKGKSINKLKLWNDAIKIDETKELFNLLFKKKAMCGSSAIVLPDRRFLIIKSDSHFTALDMNSAEVKNALEN